MKTTFTITAIAFVCLFSAIDTAAQKARPSEQYEVRLAPENDASHIQGNMRILESTGKPAAIYNGTYRVSSVGTPESKAREYLVANKKLFDLTTSDIDALRLHAVRESGGYVVRLRQTYKGLAVNKNAEITVHITPDNVVDFVQNGFQYGINLADVNPNIDKATAKQTATSRLGVDQDLLRTEFEELMVFQYNRQSYLVHKLTFTTDELVGEWESFVDAKTGALIKVEDIACYYKGKKKDLFPGAAKMPVLFKPEKIAVVNGSGTVFDPDPLSRARAVYRWSGSIGTAGFIDNSDADTPELTAQLVSVGLNDLTFDGTRYHLRGPYAYLIETENPAKTYNTTYTTTNGNFSVSRNSDMFEAVMCYYHVDAQMRHLVVDLGLTGLMPSQYSGGIRFDPHGLNGADNSHYVSSSGRFVMGEGGVDDAEDADVIIHEMGHGLHDWATSNGLSQNQGLSEGTGDYNAATYSRTKGNWNTADSQYFFQYNWDGHNPFYAGRELNYAGVYPAGLDPGGEVHNSGRIWAHANLRIAAAIGRDRSDLVFWRGMEMTNSSTNQQDAASAVYAMATTLGYTNEERYAIRQSYITAGYTMGPMVILPVKLTSFDARKAGSQTLVTWKTATEESTKTFVVERSVDGTNFSTVGTVNAAGTSTVEKSYSLTDGLPVIGNNYYRLKTVNIDGSVNFSKVVLVTFDKMKDLVIFPNPVQDVMTIKNAVKTGELSIYNVNGQKVYTKAITVASAAGTKVDITHLPDGVYVVQLKSGGEIMQGRVIKRK